MAAMNVEQLQALTESVRKQIWHIASNHNYCLSQVVGESGKKNLKNLSRQVDYLMKEIDQLEKTLTESRLI